MSSPLFTAFSLSVLCVCVCLKCHFGFLFELAVLLAREDPRELATDGARELEVDGARELASELVLLPAREPRGDIPIIIF